MPVTMEASNPFRGRRLTWYWLYPCIAVWLVALFTPTLLEWRWVRDPDPRTSGGGYVTGLVVPLVVVTAVLGFAIGWQRRWGTLWAAAGLGALVMAAGVEVEYSQGWSGGEPPPEPGPFLFYFVALTLCLGIPALAGPFVRARAAP